MLLIVTTYVCLCHLTTTQRMTPNTRQSTDVSTGEVKLVNTGFTQVYDDWWKMQRTLIDEYPMALKVFTWLIESADRRNAIIVSYSALAISLGISSRTAMRAITYLREKKLISVKKSGNMNIYELNNRIVWKDTADKKDKFSQFSAEVFIVASEQETSLRTELIGHAVPKKPSPRARQKTLDNLIGLSGSAAMMAISIFSFAQLFA